MTQDKSRTRFLEPSLSAFHAPLPGLSGPGARGEGPPQPTSSSSAANPPEKPLSSSSISMPSLISPPTTTTNPRRGITTTTKSTTIPIPISSTTIPSHGLGISSLSSPPFQDQQQQGQQPQPPLVLPPLTLRRESSTRATDRTDALWAEMQATLEAVELSAGGDNSSNATANGGGGGHNPRIFSPEHESKLDELRAAQIALAQAWARSEADEAIETVGGGGAGEAAGGGAGGAVSVGTGVGKSDGGAGVTGGGGVGTEAGTRSAKATTVGTGSAAAAATAAGNARPGSSSGAGQENLGARLEEETEVDILLARKRREANDRYFQRVSQGVLDVVAKLEEVATAMRAVEQESKELWADENESAPGSAKP